MQERNLFVIFLLYLFIQHGISGNQLSEWKNSCLTIIGELEKEISPLATTNCDSLEKVEEKLTQLNRLGFAQLDLLITYQKDDKNGPKFSDGYPFFYKYFQQPLLEAMDFCRQSKMSTTACRMDEIHKVISEFRINVNTLVPLLEILQMKDYLTKMKENGCEKCQTQTFEYIAEQLMKIKKELNNNSPSYLDDSLIEYADEQIKILSQQKINVGPEEFEKVLQILRKLFFESKFNIALNEFKSKITFTINLNELSRIGHNFFKDWEAIRGKIVSTDFEYQSIGKDLEHKMGTVLKIAHELASKKFTELMERAEHFFAQALNEMNKLQKVLNESEMNGLALTHDQNRSKLNKIYNGTAKVYSQLNFELGKMGINLALIANRSANAIVPSNSVELYNILKNDYLNVSNLRKYQSTTRAFIEEALGIFLQPNQVKTTDEISEQKIDNEN